MGRRSHKFHKRKQFHSRNKPFNFKWPVIWVLIHFASLFFLTLGIQQLNLNNGLIIVFLIGLGVTIISRIVRTFTLKKRFIVDKWFFFWSLINTFTIWLILLLTSLLQITNNVISLSFTALALVIVAYFVKKLRIARTAMIIVSIILLVILFFFSSSSINLKHNTNQVMDVQSSTKEDTSNIQVQPGNILNKITNSIKNIFSTSADTCPQLPLIMMKRGEPARAIYGKNSEQIMEECPDITIGCIRIGPQYKPFNDVVSITNGVWESPTTFVVCRNAQLVGESKSNFYCDTTNVLQWNFPSVSGIPYIVKKEPNSDVITGKNQIHKSFMNVYTRDGTFIKTICGPDPEDIVKKKEEEAKSQFKQAMKEIDDFFTI